MITLITGIPGMGKTSLLVSMLLEYEKAAERPIFVMGIPDLKLEHIVAPPVTEWTEYRQSPEDATLRLAYFTFPPNSILVVDEAQRVYRPRAAASKVPPEVAALETHRHTGLDIILLTQKPKLIDTNVRELVGRHIHIRAGLLGRYLYEWPHIADGESRLDRSDAAKRRFKPPKKAFDKYKSAEVHTKHKFRIHQIYFYLLVALGALIWKGSQALELLSRGSIDPVSQVAEQPARSRALDVSATPLDDAQPATIMSTAISSHPFIGYRFVIRGVIQSKSKQAVYLDLISPAGDVVPQTDKELIEAGYFFQLVSPCMALLKHGDNEITAACGNPNSGPNPVLKTNPIVPTRTPQTPPPSHEGGGVSVS